MQKSTKHKSKEIRFYKISAEERVEQHNCWRMRAHIILLCFVVSRYFFESRGHRKKTLTCLLIVSRNSAFCIHRKSLML